MSVNSNSRNLACASSTFSCVTDLSHKSVTFYSCQPQENSENSSKRRKLDAAVGGNRGGGKGKKQCVWFSRDYGQPIFAMHSNCYLNSECFIIDTEISVLRILPTYQLLLFKEYIHVLEDEDTKFTLEFKNGSDSFAVWIHVCAFQNLEPFSTTSVQLTNPINMIPMENHLLRSSSSWLTLKFKAPPTSATKKSNSNWFTFARMQLLSVNFKKERYLILLLKSDDPNDDAPAGLFCFRPGVTCFKTGTQLYYEPCDATRRKYILEFESESVCDNIWSFLKMVTPPYYQFHNEHLKMEVSSISSTKIQKIHLSLEMKRKRRLKVMYRCFPQIRQEVKQIMKASKNDLQDIIDMPEFHINKLFMSVPVWTERYLNIGINKNHPGMNKVKIEIKSMLSLQYNVIKLHLDIVKMLMKEKVPAELIAEYREALLRRVNTWRDCTRCQRIHGLFI